MLDHELVGFYPIGNVCSKIVFNKNVPISRKNILLEYEKTMIYKQKMAEVNMVIRIQNL